MTAQVLLLFAQLIIASDGQNIDIQRDNVDIQMNVDGEQYRMIQPLLGDGAVYISPDTNQ